MPNKLDQGIFICDPETFYMVEVNQSMTNIYGYSKDELIGNSRYMLSAEPDKSKSVVKIVEKEGKMSVPMRYHKKKDGTIFPITIEGYSLTLNGKYRMFYVVNDISEKINSEKLVKETEKKYTNLFNNMFNGFALHEIITDEKNTPIDYTFLDINPAFTKLTGLKRNLIGKTVKEVLPTLEDNWLDVYGQVALTGKSRTFESYVKGLNKWFSVIAFSPKKNQFAVIVRDVTHEKIISRELMPGHSYMLTDKTSNNILGVLPNFKENNVLLISRQNHESLKDDENKKNWQILELGEGDNFVNDLEKVLESVKKFITENKNPIIILNKLSYLRIINGSENTIRFVYKLNDLIKINNIILIYFTSESCFNENEQKIIEDDFLPFPKKEKQISLNDKQIEFLKYIKSETLKNTIVSMNKLSKKFNQSRMSTYKWIKEFESLKVIETKMIGNSKSIILTEKGLNSIS